MEPQRLLFILSCLKLSGGQDMISVSRASVQRGQSIIIPCLYDQRYELSHKYLSSGYLAALSRYVEFSDQRYQHETVFISDDRSGHVFTVRLDDVQRSRLYWCGVQIPGALDPHARFYLEVTAGPPGLSVIGQHVSGSEQGSVSISCVYRGESAVRWCKLGGVCITAVSAVLDGASVEIRGGAGLVTVVMSGLRMENSGWYCCSTPELQMPVYISVEQRMENQNSTAGPHSRTLPLLLLCVVLETLLMLTIYCTHTLIRRCKHRLFRCDSPADDGQYVTMHSTHTQPAPLGSAAAEEDYETMAELNTHTQCRQKDDDDDDDVSSTETLPVL
ncbi:uncharacterized protein si:ch1073-59l16.1 isoform X2 [Danio rerio]|uniref:Uncharacterized protein si:ch1073-59l16.1 isoform X2 n=1 Tax=Danio rerio TaxID=7955 RepID=A0AB32TCX0_DANRE